MPRLPGGAETEQTPELPVFNDEKVTDHHALLPTEEQVNMDALTWDEAQLYELVVKWFLEVLSANFRYDSLKLTLEAARHRFKTKAVVMKQLGW